MKIPKLLKPMRILTDESGASLLELGLILPSFLLLLIGAFDFAHLYLGKAIFEGAVRQAARDASLEKYNGSTSDLDTAVLKKVRTVNRSATITHVRKSFKNFDNIGNAEPFADSDGDGLCNNGETFEDINNNGTRDLTIDGANGQGGASDVVQYIATMEYPRLFGIAGFLGQPQTATITASAIVRNQPFDRQNIGSGTCK